MPSFLFQNYVEGSDGAFWIGPVLLWATVAFSVQFSSLAPDAEETKVKGVSLTWARRLRTFPTGCVAIQSDHGRNAGLKGGWWTCEWLGEKPAPFPEKQSRSPTVIFPTGENVPLKMWACYSTSLCLCVLIWRMEIRFAPFLPHQDLRRLDNGCKVLLQRYEHYHKQGD